ncbi:hypothetical protein DRO33_06630 [Candidatus Bathyarchaeota archaeon]|nr:MAG: hypothetical protein DRO33_06630 [Candidatus Bathyarchaeota archaeon]
MRAYVEAEPERIWSKLASERAVKPHVLASIAAGYASNEEELWDFFSKTFYAHQYGLGTMRAVLRRALAYLEENGMVVREDGILRATAFGRRTSELYIDPETAVLMKEALTSEGPGSLTDLSFLHMIAHTPDMWPRLRPYRRELEDLMGFLAEHEEELFFRPPDPELDAVGFEEFLGEIKVARVLDAWIEEEPEDSIMGLFDVQPGDLYRLVETGRWLLYAAQELAVLFGRREYAVRLSVLMKRVEHGVREELLQLASLRGIGRVRARLLYSAGFRSLEDLRRAPVRELLKVPGIGPRLALSIKEQVGGEISEEDLEAVKKEEWVQKSLLDYSS